MNDIMEMTSSDAIANDVAESDDPLRALCLFLAADMVELTLGTVHSGVAPDAISERLEAIMAAAEKRLIVEPILVKWVASAPAIH